MTCDEISFVGEKDGIAPCGNLTLLETLMALQHPVIWLLEALMALQNTVIWLLEALMALQHAVIWLC